MLGILETACLVKLVDLKVWAFLRNYLKWLFQGLHCSCLLSCCSREGAGLRGTEIILRSAECTRWVNQFSVTGHLVLRIERASVSLSCGSFLQRTCLSTVDILSVIKNANISALVYITENALILGAGCCSHDIMGLE
jgi:hypothetical protein